MAGSIDEMASHLPASVVFALRGDANIANLPEGARWLAGLVDGSASAGDIAERSGMPAPQALAGLLYLAQIGALEVVAAPAGWTVGGPIPDSTPAARRTDSGDSIREDALAAERAGHPMDALALVDHGISRSPNRADLHALRARLLVVTGGDPKVAATHALRAAQLESGNTNYRDMAREYASRAGLPPPDLSAAPPTMRGSEPPRVQVRAKSGLLPHNAKGWALAGTAGALVAIVLGWNVWYFALRTTPGLPRERNPKEVAAIVPLARLQIFGGTAYGSVTPAWGGIPDREKKVRSLADALAASGAHDVVLVDPENRIVARGNHDTATIFVPAPAPVLTPGK